MFLICIFLITLFLVAIVVFVSNRYYLRLMDELIAEYRSLLTDGDESSKAFYKDKLTRRLLDVKKKIVADKKASEIADDKIKYLVK